MGAGRLVTRIAAGVLLGGLGVLAFSQSYPYFPPPGISYSQTAGLQLGAPNGGAPGAGGLNIAGALQVNGVAVSAAQQPTNVPLFVYQASDQTNNQGTTLPVASTFLKFTLLPAGVYVAQCWIFYLTVNSTTLFEYVFFSTGTTTGIGTQADALYNTGTNLSQRGISSTQSFAGALAAAGGGVIRWTEVVDFTTSSNSMVLSFASSASGNVVTLKTGSWCSLQKIQ